MRGILIAAAIFCAAMQAAAADELYREELRIPMAAAGPRGLEAVLIRPAGTRRYPLALISHGTPRDTSERADMTPNRLYTRASEFARRGFAALVVMRRGYGDSGGDYAENSGPCDRRDYLIAARASVSDLRAAIDAMKNRVDVSAQEMIAVGHSTGGFASVALSADPPPGLAAVINFAGGRGSRADDDVCSESALVKAFATFGKTSRIPTLWIYSKNDRYFGPDLAHRMHAAFAAAGGRAQFIDAAAFGSDGHQLFSAAGSAIWTPMVDSFLREQNLGTRDLIAPSAASLSPPPQLGSSGRDGYASYLAGSPHKAFAGSPRGAFAYRLGLRTAAEAQDAALTACAKYAPNCTLYAVDDEIVGQRNGGR